MGSHGLKMRNLGQLFAFHFRNRALSSGSIAFFSSFAKRHDSLGAACLVGVSTYSRPDKYHPMSRRAVCKAKFSSFDIRRYEISRENEYGDDRPSKTIPIVRLSNDSIGEHEYPAFWFRDNCQCSACMHPDTRQRIVDTFSIPEDIRSESITYQAENVTITFSDKHVGVYPYDWITAHDFKVQRVPEGGHVLRFRPFESVTASYEQLPEIFHEAIMEDEGAVLEWMENIVRYGFCLVKGVPLTPEGTKALLERISYIRHTHYGGFWDFTSDLTFKDTAYTSEALGAHTDNTYFTDPARLQLFHLLSHTHGEGGATLLVDGFKAAKHMLNENERNADLLRRILQPFHSSGNDDVCIQPNLPVPVLIRDPKTKILYQIRWNNYDRAAKADWNIHHSQMWYSAARHFNEIIRRQENEIWMQLEPGTALIVDNWRMLHGRSEFTGKRRMCGGYVNNDDYVSRYRLLSLGRPTALANLGNAVDPIVI